jgi:hypothetical protein
MKRFLSLALAVIMTFAIFGSVPFTESPFAIFAKAADGQEVLLTDYASCGKNWLGKHNRITIWMNLT